MLKNISAWISASTKLAGSSALLPRLEERSHDTLDGMPPSVFRAHQTVGSFPIEVSP